MGIGSLTNFIPKETLANKWTSGPITTIGVTISNNPDIIRKTNFDPRLKCMSNILNIWLARNLSIKGKVTILKSLALPKLQYVANTMPIIIDIIQDGTFGTTKGQK
jgi:hypothetical protein